MLAECKSLLQSVLLLVLTATTIGCGGGSGSADLFGCTGSKPSHGSVPADLT